MNPEAESSMALALGMILIVLMGWMASEPWVIEIDRLESGWEQDVFKEPLIEVESSLESGLARDVPTDSGTTMPFSGKGLDILVRRLSRRLAAQVTWFPATLVFFMALLHDAMQDRLIARYSFHYTSPRLHQTARNLFKGFFLIFIALLLAPLPLHPTGLWLLSILMLIPLHALLKHAPKRI